MLLNNQTNSDFQRIKENTLTRFERSYKNVVIKEIPNEMYTVCYITALFETCKIVYDHNAGLINTSNIFCSDFDEINKQHEYLRMEELHDDLLCSLQS